ncbi:MAG: hypothetical protein ACPGTS_02270, partial [Minisyncoccia bacterium]
MRAKELSDVLAKTLGKLALKLINVGLSQIGKKSGSSIAESAASNLPAFNYQNEYDILGIANDTPEIDAFGNIAGTGGGNMNQGIDEFGNFDIYSNDPSIPFIGGPEDVNSGDNWNEGVELVINLQEELEVAYENTKREIELFEEISEIMKEMKDNTVILDRCTPGPDFGWKERFTNVFDIAEIGNAGSGGTKSDAKAIESAQQEMVDPRLNKVALNEMRLMVVDPRINIPGSKTFSSVIENTLGDSSIKEFEGILKSQLDKKNTLFILEGMRDTISIDFRKYRTNIDSRLPLFHAEWNELSQLDKLALFSLPIKDE